MSAMGCLPTNDCWNMLFQPYRIFATNGLEEDGFNLASVSGGLKLGCFGRFERRIFFVLSSFVFFCVELSDSLFLKRAEKTDSAAHFEPTDEIIIVPFVAGPSATLITFPWKVRQTGCSRAPGPRRTPAVSRRAVARPHKCPLPCSENRVTADRSRILSSRALPQPTKPNVEKSSPQLFADR